MTKGMHRMKSVVVDSVLWIQQETFCFTFIWIFPQNVKAIDRARIFNNIISIDNIDDITIINSSNMNMMKWF